VLFVCNINPMSWATDKKIFEHFSDIKERVDFLKMVKKIRKDTGLPPAGLNMEETKKEHIRHGGNGHYIWEEIVGLKGEETIINGTAQILKKLKLGRHLEYLVKGYIIQGDDYAHGMIPLTSETVGCLLDDEGDHYRLYIFPEATKNHTIAFLKANWHWIDESFKYEYRKRHALKIKTKPNRMRDKQIIELYDWGILTSAGTFNTKNALEFLARNGIEEDAIGVSAGLKSMGYNLPKLEAIKKVIQRRNKLRKG
jgi:hypothetical protein